MGIMDKMKETAAKGADLAKGGAKAAQDKLEEQKINKKIGDTKEELGGVVYAQKTGADNPTSDASFDAAIDRLVGEIRDQEVALAAVRAAEVEDAAADAAAEGAPGADA